ncbi:MAG TPA: hypothetical protein VN723_11480 [Rhizomicrobium sp.]|nr:hypothetical protein [Rhizomicrobium sp.]
MELLGQNLRRGMLRTFPFSHFRGRDYRARLAALPKVSTGNDRVEEHILADLRGDGASFAMRQDLIPLLGSGGGELIHSLAESVQSGIFGRDRQFLGNESTLAAFPGTWRLGLSPRMLELAEAYLGLSCFYLGATVKRAMPGLRAQPRQWHLDLEDERVFRVLIYLTPVDAHEGPFEFVPRLASQSVEMRAHYRSGQIADARMTKMVARSTRKVAYGEAGDGVLFDGAQVFHRNRQPLKGERYSITFAYCSRHPLALDPRRRLSHAASERVALTLSARQRDCLPPPRRS